MKRIILFLTIILLPTIIYAKEFEAKDINLKADIRDDFYVFTRDNLDNNTDLSKLGISKSYLEETMKKNNIYMDVLKKDVSYEILVVVPSKVLAFNNLSNATDSMLEELREELVKKTGATVSKVYKGNHNYIIVDYYDKNTDYYIVNYYTVVNAKGYNVQLQKKSAITEEERKDIKEFVDTIKITILDEYRNETSTAVQKKIENANKKDFNYTNVIIGAIIGAVIGLISYIIGLVIRKKKSSS